MAQAPKKETAKLIIIGLGANLPDPSGRSPRATMAAALDAFALRGVKVVARSSDYASAPVPFQPDQPWFYNAVAKVDCDLGAEDLLSLLMDVEASLGRDRTAAATAERACDRTIDLDLLDMDGLVRSGGADGPDLPHPRMSDRAFVLLPLQEIAPNWVHPVSRVDISTLIAGLGPDQVAKKLD